MNKPTHILVPIESLEKAIRQDRLSGGYGTYDYDKLVNAVNKGIEVDLSEEGIKERAINGAAANDDVASFLDKSIYEQGYQQCAKDLLNTKP